MSLLECLDLSSQLTLKYDFLKFICSSLWSLCFTCDNRETAKQALVVAMGSSISYINHKLRLWAFVGPASVVKCREDKLYISVYWISRSMKWSVLREKPESTLAVLHSMSQGTGCDGWLSAPPVPPHFLGSHPLEVTSLWKSTTRTLIPGRKTLIQYIPASHKLSNRAEAENVNVGLAITKWWICQDKQCQSVGCCLLVSTKPSA